VSPAAPAGPDPAIQQLGAAVNQNAADIQALTKAVPTLVKESIKPLAEKIDVIEGAVKPLVRFKERLDAAEEAGGIKGRIAQRIEGRLTGEDDDPVLKSKILKILAVIAGLGVVGFVVMRIHNGTSALCGLRDKVKERLIVKAPELVERWNDVEAVVHERIDAIESKVDTLRQKLKPEPKPSAKPAEVVTVAPAAPAVPATPAA
jgi:hypothetical protein